jgi:SAM-dependent methyltransferase
MSRLNRPVIQSLESASPPQLQVSGGRGPAPSLRSSPPGAPGSAYSSHARAYDRRTHAFDGFRQVIVEALQLRPGDVVLDVGCGTGRCFGMLVEKVGLHGRIVGIDASPEMVAVARDRVAHEGWENVTVLLSPAAEAEIPVSADAALFCAVHDILRSPEALHNVLASLRPGARVSAGGGKWAAFWMVALNWRVRSVHAPYVASFEGFDRPWSHLERLIRDVDVRELAWGSGYVATGRVR